MIFIKDFVDFLKFLVKDFDDSGGAASRKFSAVKLLISKARCKRAWYGRKLRLSVRAKNFRVQFAFTVACASACS